MAAHRYWRIYISASTGFPGFAEIELHSSVGGSDLTGSGTASASATEGSNVPANGVDNNNATFWGTYPATIPQSWTYDFGSGNAFEIVEVVITSRADQYYAEAPASFILQYSDDGTNFTDIASFAGITWSGQSVSQTFSYSPLTALVSDDLAVLWTGEVAIELGIITASYTTPLSAGDRTGSIVISTTIYNYGRSIIELIDGIEDDSNFWFATASVAGEEIKFQFPGAIILKELKFLQGNTATHGVWQIQGSDDGTTWIDIGSNFTLGGAATQTITGLSANTTPYFFYRLLGISGNTDSGPYIYEFLFKIEPAGTEPSYLNVLGSGDRTALITLSCSAATLNGILSNLINSIGLVSSVYFNTVPIADLWLKFDFDADKKITEVLWLQSSTSELGTWKWQGSTDDTNWEDIGNSFVLGGALYQKHTELANNTSGYRYYRLLGVSGSAVSSPFIIEVNFQIGVGAPSPYQTKTIGDSNEINWQDQVLIDQDFSLAIEDTNEVFNDEINLNIPLSLLITDNLFAFYDEVEVQSWVFFNSQTVAINDSFTEFEDSLDALAIIFIADVISYELGESFHLSDQIDLFKTVEIQLTDDLNLWDEGINVMPGEFVDYAYDTMMYDLLDSIELDLRQHRVNIDSLYLTDAVSVSLAVFSISCAVADSLNNWNDIITYQRPNYIQLFDYFVLHDSINLKMPAGKGVADSLVLSDSVIVQLSRDTELVSDSVDLWNDLVQAEITVRLTVNKSDSMSQSDALNNSGTQEDTSYYRRYLNDVLP